MYLPILQYTICLYTVHTKYLHIIKRGLSTDDVTVMNSNHSADFILSKFLNKIQKYTTVEFKKHFIISPCSM
jgi:hypothetical protein